MAVKTKIIKVQNINIGGGAPFVLMAGPCVIESRAMVLKSAARIQKITQALGIPFIFKASYDKANRTSINSFRGPGLHKGLEILREVKETLGLAVLSDIHSINEVEAAAKVLDILQIPAFLCRQTDLVVEAAQTQKPLAIKKGQFLAPADMQQVIKKVESTKNRQILITERGTSFGYNTLVTDFRSLSILRAMGYPVVFDATHSVQQPGGQGQTSGGDRSFVPLLARCAVAAGCDAIFVETHVNPKKALSDGPNMLPLAQLEKFLIALKAIEGALSVGKSKTLNKRGV